MSASPDSFSRTRLKAGCNYSPTLKRANRRMTMFSPAFGGDRGPQVLDRLAGVLVLVDVLLLQQHDLFHPLAELALGDLRADVLGLVGGLLLEDAQLGLLRVLGDLLLGDVERVGRRDLQGNLARELLEVVVAGDEVGLAVDLHEHADLAGRVDVRRDRAFAGGALAALGGLRLALDAQDLDRLLDVAVALDERLLAVHHPGPGLIAEGLDVLGADGRFCHV